MRHLTNRDLSDLRIGSSVLGSGGGGDPAYPYMMTQYQMSRYGSIQIITVEELSENDLVVPIGVIGAPLINMERMMSGRETEAVLMAIERRLGRKPTVLMAGEIGGANAFTPLLIASKLGLPVLDADLIGRAFPELPMNVCHLQNMSANPAFIADCLGNTVIIETPHLDTLERLARNVVVGMGSSAVIALHIMNGKEAKKVVIPGSISQAISIGRIINEAKRSQSDPIDAMIDQMNARRLAHGTIIDVEQTIQDGFLQGSVLLQCKDQKIRLFYQNEYLLAVHKKNVLAATPDILMLMEEGSGIPISSEALKVGLTISLIVLPAPAIWKTPKGLALVGPQVFGFEDGS